MPDSGHQAHDVDGAAALLRAFRQEYLELQRDHQSLQSMMSRKNFDDLNCFLDA
jgi:hypothetical protein